PAGRRLALPRPRLHPAHRQGELCRVQPAGVRRRPPRARPAPGRRAGRRHAHRRRVLGGEGPEHAGRPGRPRGNHPPHQWRAHRAGRPPALAGALQEEPAMITIWNLIQAVLGTWWVTSPLLGWLGSVVVTQTYKRQALRRKWMDADTLATVSWILAVISGFSFTAWTAPLFQGVDPPAVLLAAVLTGLWSPFAF